MSGDEPVNPVEWLKNELNRTETLAVGLRRENEELIATGERTRHGVDGDCPEVSCMVIRYWTDGVLAHVRGTREILAEHPDELGFCPRCAEDLDWTAVPPRRKALDHPCPTVLSLARMWGWTEADG